MTEKALEKRKVEAITFDDVRNYLCPDANRQEIALFLKTCQTEGLNPFAKEIYLVKYSKDQPASIVIAHDSFLKAAESSADYDGHEAGIILKTPGGQPEFREGSFMLDEEQERLVGGWAKVFRKDRDKPFYAAVNIREYRKYTRDRTPTRFWNEMPATMIRKVALSHALREAFPNRFAGTYTTAEFEEIPEGQLPPAFIKNGKPDWTKFWARQNERGLDTERVHVLLGVSSIKDEWIGKGRTLEEADDAITKAIEEMSPEEVATEVIAEGKVIERDVSLIRTEYDFNQACFQDFNLQPPAALRLAGYLSKADVRDWSSAYMNVAGCMGAQIVEPSA